VDAKELDSRLGAPGLTAEEIAGLSALVAKSGAAEQVEQRIERLMADSLAALEAAPLADGTARAALRALAEAATVRRY
jgi:geranylgeranyl diphosphate synthase type I